jgi:GT2 family glycosyltransferase
MYGEDIDWSYRFHKAGWKRVYFAGARAFHYGGGSSELAPTRFYVEMRRANLQFFRKHHGKGGFFAFLAATCLHEIVRVVGNIPLFIVNRASREQAVQKIGRSLTCLRSLFRHCYASEAPNS